MQCASAVEVTEADHTQERDAFILVLIDGDGMIFDEDLIKHGEAGGKEAASRLWNVLHVQAEALDLPSDVKVVTRIYANLKGLGEICAKAGIITRPEIIESFARGFTGSKQLFDFVDVGMGKDRADDKICGTNVSLFMYTGKCSVADYPLPEIFKLHLYDCHCRHIFFGCSHDNGYARLLEDVAEPSILNSITLLEGVPFERELAALKTKYHTTRLDGLFRTTKINTHAPYPFHQSSLPPQTNGLVSNGLPPGLPPPAHYQSPYQPTIIRTPSASTTDSAAMKTAPSTWASTAMAATLQTASPPPTPQATPASQKAPEILRNRFGQRIDPIIQYDPNEVKRIKKLKMCNVHFLRDDCPFDPCTHDHYYKPNKNELLTLRYVSRMTPCKFGTECDDSRCIYGHRCPNDVEGKKDCRFGENCRFEREAHGIDRTPVKTLKVGGK